MSLVNAADARIAASGELVPSRYALRIGEIDVLVISDGVLPLPTAMLAHNAAPAVRAAWLDEMYLPPHAFDWPLNAVVVRSGGQTILIDAGLGLVPDLHGCYLGFLLATSSCTTKLTTIKIHDRVESVG